MACNGGVIRKQARFMYFLNSKTAQSSVSSNDQTVNEYTPNQALCYFVSAYPKPILIIDALYTRSILSILIDISCMLSCTMVSACQRH